MRLFTADELRLIGIVVGGATILAVLGTVIVGLARDVGHERPGDETRAVQTGTAPVGFADMVVPENYASAPFWRWYYYRPPLEQWTDEQVAEFWIDPRDIGLDLLESKNDEVVDEFFGRVP